MPNIHPFLVHFPIALLPIGFVLDLLSIILKKSNLSESAWIVQSVGTIFLVVAVMSGLMAESSGVVSEGARNQFEMHQQLAFFATMLFLPLFFWRIGAKGKIPNQAASLYLLIMAAGIVLLLFTAWAGAELVYTFGVGVNPQ